MRCPTCGSSFFTTCRHMSAEVSCSHCGFKIREEGKDTQIVSTLGGTQEGTDLFETAKEVIEKLQEKYQ